MELDRDCLFTIFTYLTSWDLVTKRLVCHEWDHACCTNSLWESRFITELGPPREDVTSSYLQQYIYWMNRFPAPIVKRQRVQNETGCLFDVWTDYVHMKLNCDKDEVNETSHQLAVILSLLSMNTHIRLTDTLEVGTTKSYRPILFSQFCYLMLSGQKEALLSENETEKSDNDNKMHEAIGIALGGNFDPLISYNIMQGCVSTVSEIMDRFDPIFTDPLFLENKFGSEEEYHIYKWSEVERRNSWCPVYWSQSFRLHNSVDFVSVYNANTKIMTVLQPD